MMGPHHAATGAAAWLFLTTRFSVDTSAIAASIPAIPQSLEFGLALLPMSAGGVIAGAIVTAGAALLPDADHRHATIAHSLPPLSNMMCRSVGRLSGGHRHGTHSLLGLAVFVLIAVLAGMWSIRLEHFGLIFPAAGLLTILLASFAAKVLRVIPDSMRKFPWVLGIAVGVFVTLFSPQEPFWFPLAVGLGVAVHIVGDILTTGGCNLLWPLTIKPPRWFNRLPLVSNIWKRSGNVSIPILGNAGSWREWLLLVPVTLYVAVCLIGTTAVWLA